MKKLAQKDIQKSVAKGETQAPKKTGFYGVNPVKTR
jgi:hypothetical protein